MRIRDRGSTDSFVLKLRNDVIDQLLIPGPKKCVLSSEMLFFCETSESLETIAKIAKERFDRVTILCYLRRQDLLAVAHRNQVANGAAAASFYGSDPSPIPQFSPHLKRYYDYATKLNSCLLYTTFVKDFITRETRTISTYLNEDRLEFLNNRAILEPWLAVFGRKAVQVLSLIHI